jgi:hypothetical protein
MSDDGAIGVHAEAELIAFADAAVRRTASLEPSRETVIQALGPAAIIAGFDAITRVADGSGIPLEDQKAIATESWRRTLGIDAFWEAKV